MDTAASHNSASSPWRPRGVLAMSPLRMRTTGAKLIYVVGFPLQYLLLFACIGNYFAYAIKSVLFAVFLAYHIAAPLAAWVYETRNNPYAFAHGMLGMASHEEERELLESNRRAVQWYLEEGIFTADFGNMPARNGFRKSPSGPLL